MKKKLLSLIAVSAALATAGSALIACGGGNGGANAEVTKEQWAAALSVDNFANNFKATVLTVNENEKAQQEYVFIAGANKYGDYYMSRTIKSLEGVKDSERSYIRIAGTEKDAYYSRRSNVTEVEGQDGEWQDGPWIVSYEDHETFNDWKWMKLLEDVGLTYMFKLADKYDSFEYKNGAYTLKGEDGIVVKFADGKFASAELTMTQNSESTYDGETTTGEPSFKVTLKVSYGTQTITAPADAVEEVDDE